MAFMKRAFVSAIANMMEKIERRVYGNVVLPEGFTLDAKDGAFSSPRSVGSLSTTAGFRDNQRRVRFLLPDTEANGLPAGPGYVIVTPMDEPRRAKRKPRRVKSAPQLQLGSSSKSSSKVSPHGRSPLSRPAYSPVQLKKLQRRVKSASSLSSKNALVLPARQSKASRAQHRAAKKAAAANQQELFTLASPVRAGSLSGKRKRRRRKESKRSGSYRPTLPTLT